MFLGTFIQPATAIGSSSVCVRSSQTFNCTVEVYINSGIGFIIVDTVWTRDGVIITDSSPRHTLLRTQYGQRQVVTGLMVNDTTLDDDGAVYSCTIDGAPDDFISNVTLNVVGGMYICIIMILSSIDEVIMNISYVYVVIIIP